MKHFIDNSIAPIIAIDFDGTICVGNGYPDPHNGAVRSHAKEIINFMYDMGIKVVIWTNRKNVPDTDIKDKMLMKQWLSEMGIKYHTVNDSTHFAPFKYYGRKLYAHMFVDDRGFGWNESSLVMADVLREFLSEIVGCSDYDIDGIMFDVIAGKTPDSKYVDNIKNKIINWNKKDDDNVNQ